MYLYLEDKRSKSHRNGTKTEQRIPRLKLKAQELHVSVIIFDIHLFAI